MRNLIFAICCIVFGLNANAMSHYIEDQSSFSLLLQDFETIISSKNTIQVNNTAINFLNRVVNSNALDKFLKQYSLNDSINYPPEYFGKFLDECSNINDAIKFFIYSIYEVRHQGTVIIKMPNVKIFWKDAVQLNNSTCFVSTKPCYGVNLLFGKRCLIKSIDPIFSLTNEDKLNFFCEKI